MKRRRSWLFRSTLVACRMLALWVIVTSAAVAVLRWHAPPTSAVMLFEPGPLDAVAYRWVDRAGISRNAALAVIASEDQTFIDHFGFDVAQLNDAIGAYRAGGELRGASTITQQVAKNMFLWNGRSFVRKALEAYFAVVIEVLWSKQRILEVYLNVAEFGPGVFGVEAAAQRYFGTSADRLTAPQAALLAAALPSPKRLSVLDPNDYLRTRQTEIEREMRLLAERGHYDGLVW